MVEVVITLDSRADRVGQHIEGFLELNDMHKLVVVYTRLDGYPHAFLERFRIFHFIGWEKIKHLRN
jgi:hypothetical protein